MKKIIVSILIMMLCVVALTACGSSEETSSSSDESSSEEPTVYSVGDVIKCSNYLGDRYSVCITDWGTSVDGSLLNIFSLETVTWFQYVIVNTGDESMTISDNIFSIYADDYTVDTKWTEEGTFLETLAPGKKTSGKVYAEMNADNVNKIEVQVNDSMVLVKDGQSEDSGEDSYDASGEDSYDASGDESQYEDSEDDYFYDDPEEEDQDDDSGEEKYDRISPIS